MTTSDGRSTKKPAHKKITESTWNQSLKNRFANICMPLFQTQMASTAPDYITITNVNHQNIKSALERLFKMDKQQFRNKMNEEA